MFAILFFLSWLAFSIFKFFTSFLILGKFYFVLESSMQFSAALSLLFARIPFGLLLTLYDRGLRLEALLTLLFQSLFAAWSQALCRLCRRLRRIFLFVP
jgi:hypothetical protein